MGWYARAARCTSGRDGTQHTQHSAGAGGVHAYVRTTLLVFLTRRWLSHVFFDVVTRHDATCDAGARRVSRGDR
jgi:hypothetical protein